MSITRVQAPAFAQTTASTTGGPIGPVSQAFGSNNTAGNTIIVWIFVYVENAGGSYSGETVTDTQGNTYTQAFIHRAPYQGGVGLAAYVASNIKAGANTVSFNIGTAAGGGFSGSWSYQMGISVAEYSGFGTSPSIISSGSAIYAGGAIASQGVTASDSFANSETFTFSFSNSTYLGVGVFDLFANGTNYFMGAAVVVSGCSLSGTSPYTTFNSLFGSPPAFAGGNEVFEFDPGSPYGTVQQPQIFAVT